MWILGFKKKKCYVHAMDLNLFDSERIRVNFDLKSPRNTYTPYFPFLLWTRLHFFRVSLTVLMHVWPRREEDSRKEALESLPFVGDIPQDCSSWGYSWAHPTTLPFCHCWVKLTGTQYSFSTLSRIFSWTTESERLQTTFPRFLFCWRSWGD